MPTNLKISPKEKENQNEIVKNNDDQVIVREITQTDKLNKRLLQSFLHRINETKFYNNVTENNNSSNQDFD